MKKRNLILVTLILLLSFSATALAEETTGETSPEAALSDDASASVVTLNQAPEAITSAAKSGMDYSLGYERISITYNNYIVDTLNGIPAYYNVSGSGYDCAEYVNRYYSTLYGISYITSHLGGSYNGYDIVRTYQPKTGDIVYATAAQRGKSYGHYAIVKSYSDGVLTLIEQNWDWTADGVRLAAKNRRIPFPTSSSDSYGQYYDTYYVYTVKGISTSDGYKDVSDDHWAAEYIYSLTESEILAGNGDGTFEPEEEITRAEFATILAKAAGINASDYSGSAPFSDVASSQWYAPYVAWAHSEGIVTGYPDNTFGPNNDISREDIATMLGRFVEKYYGSLPPVNAAKIFADNDSISDYAAEYVSSMQQANVINGYEDNYFRPQNSASRAETAKMVGVMLTAAE